MMSEKSDWEESGFLGESKSDIPKESKMMSEKSDWKESGFLGESKSDDFEMKINTGKGLNFDPLPTNDYYLVISDIKRSVDENSGNTRFDIEFSVYRPHDGYGDERDSLVGRKVWDMFYMRESMQWKIEAIARGIYGENKDVTINSSTIHGWVGKCVKAYVKIVRQKGYDDKNKIATYSFAGEESVQESGLGF